VAVSCLLPAVPKQTSAKVVTLPLLTSVLPASVGWKVPLDPNYSMLVPTTARPTEAEVRSLTAKSTWLPLQQHLTALAGTALSVMAKIIWTLIALLVHGATPVVTQPSMPPPVLKPLTIVNKLSVWKLHQLLKQFAECVNLVMPVYLLLTIQLWVHSLPVTRPVLSPTVTLILAVVQLSNATLVTQTMPLKTIILDVPHTP